MALTHRTSTRNAVCNLVVDEIDAGSANAAGQLVLLGAADAEVATVVMGNPAFGAASDGVAIAAPVTPDTSATGGTATKFEMQDRDEDAVFEGTFGTTGADLIGTGVVIEPGDTVDINDGDLSYECMP